MLTIITTFIRRYWNRAFNNGETFDYASLDAQLADLALQGNQNKARLEAISTPAGSLRYAQTQATRFTATGGQTAFTMTTYDHTNDLVAAYTNSGSGLLTRIDDSLVTKTSDTVVTLPAQVAGATVIIEVRSAGNGTSQLASTTSGQGSGLVGYANGTGLGTQVNVQGALDELYTNLNSASFLGGVITLTGFLKANGSVALTGDLPAGGHKITGLGAGTASSNDAARMADITPAALKAALGTYLNASYVPLIGGVTMTGNLDFGNAKKITGLPQATGSGEALTYDQLPTLNSFKNAIVNGGAVLANGSDYVASVSGTYGYGKSELCKGALAGSAVAGTLTQATGSNVGRTGRAFSWSLVTTTGAGIATWRFYVEAKDALRFLNQKATISAQFRHNVGSDIQVSVNVYAATAADNFAGLATISSGAAITVHTDANTPVYNRGVAMGNCANGILVEVSAAIGAVTNKTFDLTEVQLEVGSVETTFEYEPVLTTLRKMQRYFAALALDGTAGSLGGFPSTLVANGGTQASGWLWAPCEMIKPPALGTESSAATQFNAYDTVSHGVTTLTSFAASAGRSSKYGLGFVINVASGFTSGVHYVLQAVSAPSTDKICLDARF